MQRVIICAVVLSALASAGAVPMKHAAAKGHGSVKHRQYTASEPAPKTIPCSTVPVAFCNAAAGCQVVDEDCQGDPNSPPINCTALMTSTGAAVASAELALMTSIESIKSSAWTTMKGTQAALGVAEDAIKSYDSALKSYNSSLIAYEKEADKLDLLSAQLVELTTNCSIPVPPLTCPGAIMEIKASIAKQNATCELTYIKTTLEEQKMQIMESAVEMQDAVVTQALAVPAKVFSDAAADINAAETNKKAAIAFWTVVKNACIHPAAMPAASVASQHKKSAMKRLSRKH